MMLRRGVDFKGCGFQMELFNMPIHLKITLPLWKTSSKSSTGVYRFEVEKPNTLGYVQRICCREYSFSMDLNVKLWYTCHLARKCIVATQCHYKSFSANLSPSEG